MKRQQHGGDRVLALLRSLADITDGFATDQLTHCLQTATRAERAGADPEVVVASLCHDIGKAISVPNHPAIAAEILKPYVRDEVYSMIRAHQDFQGRHYYQHFGGDPDAREKYRGAALVRPGRARSPTSGTRSPSTPTTTPSRSSTSSPSSTRSSPSRTRSDPRWGGTVSSRPSPAASSNRRCSSHVELLGELVHGPAGRALPSAAAAGYERLADHDVDLHRAGQLLALRHGRAPSRRCRRGRSGTPVRVATYAAPSNRFSIVGPKRRVPSGNITSGSPPSSISMLRRSASRSAAPRVHRERAERGDELAEHRRPSRASPCPCSACGAG